MDPFIMKNFEIACLHVWERSWLDKMQAVELNPWTSGRLTNPKERTKMSMQGNSAVRMIGPTRNTSKSPTTMSENPSTVGLPFRHHQYHANRLHETRNRGVMRRNRVQARKSVSFATGVEREILPGFAHQQIDDCQDVDEVGTEPSSDADNDLFGLDWFDDPIATINSVTEQNDRIRGGKELLAFVLSTMYFPSQCVPSILWKRPPSRRAELVSKEQTGHTSSTYGQRRFRVKTSTGSNMNIT